MQDKWSNVFKISLSQFVVRDFKRLLFYFVWVSVPPTIQTFPTLPTSSLPFHFLLFCWFYFYFHFLHVISFVNNVDDIRISLGDGEWWRFCWCCSMFVIKLLFLTFNFLFFRCFRFLRLLLQLLTIKNLFSLTFT